MSHNHEHTASSKNLKIAFFINLFFAVIELIGGLYINSIAILSDAFHDMCDSLSIGYSWYLEKKSHQKRDKFFSYGYKRFSLLGAIFISFVLAAGSIFVIIESIERILKPEAVDSSGMIIFAVLGIIFNGIAAYRLNHGDTFIERAVFLHILEDVLGWAAVLIAAIVMTFIDTPILDPITSLLITCWILSNAYKNLKPALKVFLQEVPQDINLSQLEKEISSFKNVMSYHDVHVWSLDGRHNIMSLHIVISEDLNNDEIVKLKNQIRQTAERYKIKHLTIEIEYENESLECSYMKSCP